MYEMMKFTVCVLSKFTFGKVSKCIEKLNPSTKRDQIDQKTISRKTAKDSNNNTNTNAQTKGSTLTKYQDNYTDESEQ